MEKLSSITGVILVGGKSRRMGKDKAFLEIEGVPMFERVLSAMKDIFASILLVGSGPERFAGYALTPHPDIYPGSALGGLYTGLYHAETELIFVASCDIPFPSASLIHHLSSLADGFDAVVPRTGDLYEPLFAIYRKSCLEAMKRLLEQENFRIYDFYPEINVRYVTAGEVARLPGGARSLVNINTPEEFASCMKQKENPHGEH
jgi:molybdopterin-guanine dinucleotide biosynthesis protein A